MAPSAAHTKFKLKSSTDQRYQLLKLQNRDPAQSFTDGRISCRDGYIQIHYGVLMAGADPLSMPMFINSLYYEEPNLRTIDATDWTVKEMSTIVFLFYVELCRVTFHENNEAEYFQEQLQDRLKALSGNPAQAVLLTPLLHQNVRGLTRNRLLAKMSDSLDGMTVRFTRTDGHGNGEGDYLISTDGNITPAPSSEPIPTSALEPPANATYGVSTITRAAENFFPTSILGTRNDCETCPSPSNFVSNRTSEAEMDVDNNSSPNRAPLLNNVTHSPSPPLVESHQSLRPVCNIGSCPWGFDSVKDLIRHTHHHHGLFKLRHYRLRKVPQCLICSSKSTSIRASPEDLLTHVYECLQSKRVQLRKEEWEPDFKRQLKHYLPNPSSTAPWYEQLEDSPTSFTQEEYDLITQEDGSDEENESESDDSLLFASDPEDEESPSDTEDGDELCLQIVTEDIPHRVLIS